MKLSHSLALAAAVAALSTHAYAHEDWIEPSQFSFSQTEKKRLPYTLGFDITASDNYFNADRNRLLENFGGFSFTVTAPDGLAVTPTSLNLTSTKTSGEVALTQKGTYILSLTRTSEPMYYSELNLPGNKGLEYIVLAKDQLNAEQLGRWNSTGAYYHNAKVFVTVDKDSDNWKIPLHHNKEIMPLSNPNALVEGNPFPVQVFFKGDPMPEAEIRTIYQDYQSTSYGSAPHTMKADKDGKASLTFNRPGRWIIETHHNMKHTDTTKAGKTKYAAVLMVEVKAKK